jgi:hypothetical protein
MFLQLRRQLLFLRNSVDAYDSGCIEESIRVAVVIRVLLHDARYKSLLHAIGKKESLKLVTTAASIPEGQIENYKAEFTSCDFLRRMTFSDDFEYDPVSEGEPEVSCDDWWLQPVYFRNGMIFNRKDVVLAAANKDGGAHVSEPDTNLNALKEPVWTKREISADGEVRLTPLDNHHFRILRRLGDEILMSKDLIALSNQSK